MVQSVVKGVPLQSRRRDISQDQFEGVLQEVGKILRKIHTTTVSGAYQRNEDGTWSFPNWQALMKSMVDGRREEMELSIQGGMQREQIEDILARAERVDDTVTALPLVLNHGDFMPEHIYVGDDLQITGIIDFGDCKGAVSIHDFSFITLIGPNIPLAPILEGYGDERLSAMEDAIRNYAMLLGLGHLAHNVKKGRGPEVEHNRKRLEELLKTA
jgi:Ser/Thr protein kinase RdoA (MazF antagonist)